MNTAIRGAAACRWSARIIGALLCLLILVMAVGDGMPNPFTQPVRLQVGFLALALILAGIVAGWRWEFWGGIVSLSGWGLFVLFVITPWRSLNWLIVGLA